MEVVQSKEWEIDRQQCLGKGAYAQVFKGKWIGKEVAVKRILSIDFIHTDREQITMENLEHPNVLKLFAVKADENFKSVFLLLFLFVLFFKIFYFFRKGICFSSSVSPQWKIIVMKDMMVKCQLKPKLFTKWLMVYHIFTRKT